IDEVNQQRLAVLPGERIDIRVEKIVDQVFVPEDILALYVQAELELGPGIVADLFARTFSCGLAIQPGGIPVRNVDGYNAADLAPTQLTQRNVWPELPLGDGRQCPRRIDVQDMAAHDGHVLAEVELDAVHPR